MVTNPPQIGKLVYYTTTPIALLMKTEDSENLWKIGIILQNIDNYQYIIMGENGKEEQCWITMVRQLKQ